MRFLFRLLFILFICIILVSLLFHFLKPVFLANSVIIPYGLEKFDICKSHPREWYYLKIIYLIFYLTTSIIFSNYIFSRFFSNILFKKQIPITYPNTLYFNIGKHILESKGLFQNILITGSIGCGKTSSAMYPFCEQLIKFKSKNIKEKLGILILDVKGNFNLQIKEYANLYNRYSDLIIIELNGSVKYNPLHKPHLKASILANRLKTILTLFSENNADSYWLDKAETAICEAIKICRIYNNGYVTFSEIHKLILYPNYLSEKRKVLRKIFQSATLSKKELFDLSSSIDFFDNEFNNLDSRVLSIIKSEISRITGVFINDLDVYNTFCADINELTFTTFSDVINTGKIVVLNMNLSEYSFLSKIIATYLKLDFQTEVISSISNNSSKTCAFVCDEYHEYVTKGDADFFSQSREAKCINIVSTQSYTSILKTLNDINSTRVIIQSLINKLWFRNDDIFTIEEIQKQLGKEDKIKISKSLSENSNSVSYNYLLRDIAACNSSLSESISTYVQKDYIYDTSFFTQHLDTFNCIGFLTDGIKASNKGVIYMKPYFGNTIKGGDT